MPSQKPTSNTDRLVTQVVVLEMSVLCVQCEDTICLSVYSYTTITMPAVSTKSQAQH